MIRWSPQPRQYVALTCPATHLLFGGAAGGGKSDFLLADALARQEAGGEHWRGVLFRRTYPELEEIISRSHELFTGRGVYHTQTKTWRFENGSTLKLRYLEADTDCYNYQGHQYCWIGFDELGLYPTSFAYDYLKSRLRSPYGIPCVMRSTANPGGPGHAWVKARWIEGQQPNTLWENDGETYVFIPSKLEDNEILMRNDPGYARRLESLPEHLRRALRDGDWDVFSGQVFSEFRTDRHIIRPTPLGAGWAKFASMDWGYARPFSVGFWAVNRDGRMIRYREWYGCKPGEPNVGLKLAASQVAAESFSMGAAEGCDQMVADPACWSKIDDSPSIADKFAAAGWRMTKADNDRLNGLARVHDLLVQTADDGRPMLLVFDGCHAFRRTIPLLVADLKRPEDIDTSGEDHIYDETRYAALSPWAKEPRLIVTRDRLPPNRDREPERDILRVGL
jgi:hypothetical protein